MNLIESAEKYARMAHTDQFRRDMETPYITHPEAVAKKLQGESDEVIAVAWLHDVLEDTMASESELHDAGFPWKIIAACIAMTHHKEDTYDAYIQRVKQNPIARKVKVADILHNLSCEPTTRQIKKYSKALLELI